MIRLTNISFQNRFMQTGLLTFILVSLFACNKTVEDNLVKEYPQDAPGTHSQNKKVLYLILDGAEGRQVDSLRPKNISSLLKTSVYTWIGISGSNQKDTVLPGAWASMITGVNSDKTKVETGFDTADLEKYPTIFTRIKNLAPKYRTSGYAASPMFGKNLLHDATTSKVSPGDDAQVTQNVINDLKKDSSKLIVGQFHSIAEAGDQYGYSYRYAPYANAINQVDGYIGEILTALKARPNYPNEDWMVVIASNENGKVDNNTGDSTSAYNDTRRNSFIIYNNARFMNADIGKNGTPSTKGLSAYVDSTLLLTGQGSTGVDIKVDDPKRVYDFKQGDSITIAFKMKFLTNKIEGGNYFLNLVSTATGFYGSGNGWAFWRTSDGLLLYISDNNGHYTNLDMSVKIKDNNWHTLSATLAWPKNSNKVHINLYFDGIIDISDRVVTLDNDLTAGRPLVIGHGAVQASVGNYTDYYITDFRYWKALLPYDIITQYNCKNVISTSSPYFPYLAADIRINDGNESKIVTDYSYNHQNGIINDPSNLATWHRFNEVSNAVCPAPDKNFYKATPNGLDIPIQIYQWLGIIPEPSWGLDGQYWSNGYKDVQLPENY